MIEKVDIMKKSNKLAEILSTRKAKYIVGTILFSGLGIAIPRIIIQLALVPVIAMAVKKGIKLDD